MSVFRKKEGPAWKRALSTCFRVVFRAVRLAFVLLLVILPVPVAAAIAVILKPNRRNDPAQVLRKE